MNEYEFRLVVARDRPFEVLHGMQQRVLYARPHFRFRRRRLETKVTVSTLAVHHLSAWFRWVHSLETPHRLWSRSTHAEFLDLVQNHSQPFRAETRLYARLDDRACVYTFRHEDGTHRLVFEWEYGTFPEPQTVRPEELLHHLDAYRDVLTQFFSPSSAPPPYELKESVRKSVKCGAGQIAARGRGWLVARKLDGVFGFVTSRRDRVEARWEDGTRLYLPGTSLGDGLVFGAERMADGTVVLLDVYQVRGHPTGDRRGVLLDFLPRLALPEKGFRVQTYRESVAELPETDLETDGYVAHDCATDEVRKWKERHSLDLVYSDGYLWVPGEDGKTRRFRCREKLEEGRVYEVDVETGKTMRMRTDRVVGNTPQQIAQVLSEGREWRGPKMQEVVKVEKRGRKRKKE